MGYHLNLKDKRMKYILNIKDFKNVPKLNEAGNMDYSNRTHFSESLLGRGMNKFFSSAKKTYIQQVLFRQLAQKIENEYFKGILAAMAFENAEIKQKAKSSNTACNVEVISLANEAVTISADEDDGVFTYTLINNTKSNQYKAKITPEDDKATAEPAEINPLGDEKMKFIITAEDGTKKEYLLQSNLAKSNDTDIELVSVNKADKNLYKIEDGFTDNDIVKGIRTYDITSVKQDELIGSKITMKPVNEKAKIEPVGEQELSIVDGKTVALKYKVTAEDGTVKDWTINIIAVANISKNELIKYVDKNVANVKANYDTALATIEKADLSSENSLAIALNIESENLSKLVAEIKKEECNDKDYGLIVQAVKHIDGIIKKVNEVYPEPGENLKNALIKFEKVKNDLDAKKPESGTEISDEDYKKKVSVKPEKPLSKEEIVKYLTELTQNVNSKIDKLKADGKYTDEIDKMKNQLLQIAHPDKAETVDINQVKAAYKKFEEVLANIKEMNQYKSYNSSYYDFIYEKKSLDVKNKINEFYNIINEELIDEEFLYENVKIRDIMKGATKLKKKELKDAYAKYGKIDVSKLDAEDMANKFRTNPKLREEATMYVDKEALKGIQLGAEITYDTARYKDQRNDVYSRVNFTTTEPDMLKLKNVWMKKIAKAKSDFAPFFVDDAGNFPKILDPVALVNSDETFRKSFNQYDYKKNGVSTPPPKETQNALKFKGANITASSTGIITISINRSLIGLVVKKVEVDNVPISGKNEKKFVYRYLFVIDFDALNKENLQNKSSDDIKTIINNHKFLRNEKGEIISASGNETIPTDIKILFDEILTIDKNLINNTIHSNNFIFENFDIANLASLKVVQTINFRQNGIKNEQAKTYVVEVSNNKVSKVIDIAKLEDNPEKYIFKVSISTTYIISKEGFAEWGITDQADLDKIIKLQIPVITTIFEKIFKK